MSDTAASRLANHGQGFVRNHFEKAKGLLARRGLLDQMNFRNLGRSMRQALFRELIELQSAIYLLDACGENTWLVSDAELATCWSRIEDCAGLVQGLDLSAFEEIKQYQNIEAGMRQGVPTCDVPIGEFYFKKTCDVRLMRTIVNLRARQPVGAAASVLWLAFDLVSEVQDDFDDLWEDLAFFNGNRVLSSLHNQGITVTAVEYREFVRSLLSVLDEQPGAAGYNKEERFLRFRIATTGRRLLSDIDRVLA